MIDFSFLKKIIFIFAKPAGVSHFTSVADIKYE